MNAWASAGEKRPGDAVRRAAGRPAHPRRRTPRTPPSCAPAPQAVPRARAYRRCRPSCTEAAAPPPPAAAPSPRLWDDREDLLAACVDPGAAHTRAEAKARSRGPSPSPQGLRKERKAASGWTTAPPGRAGEEADAVTRVVAVGVGVGTRQRSMAAGLCRSTALEDGVNGGVEGEGSRPPLPRPRGQWRRRGVPQLMLLKTPNICWRSCSSCGMYSPSSNLQGRMTQRVGLWNTSRSKAVRHRDWIGSVNFSAKKNLRLSELQNTTCFVSLGRLQQCRLSTGSHMLNLKSDVLSGQKFASVSWGLGSMPGRIAGIASGVGFAVSGMASAEGPVDNSTDGTVSAESSTNLSHGKKVHTDYSVTGIPGDGRCLFRSVAHGACIRSRKPVPNEDHQRKLADELRIMGDFDTYVSQIRKPHVWGGEPELLMASHVLRMPITVYMHDKEAGGLITIAEYGQEYGTEAPIQVLYHGYGHYDALQIPGKGGPRLVTQQHPIGPAHCLCFGGREQMAAFQLGLCTCTCLELAAERRSTQL
ncbi:hypothetical protein U9M48_014747 [Paspalum notatum var. saurae]|uniref:Ubiquitin thioesterase OTU n=1 Tax=Paspalum notatum var. saurae TaxID=547442 RepID=A0AAQ3T2P3_PASNO